MTPHVAQPKRVVLIDSPPGRSEKIFSAGLVIAAIAAFTIMAPFARVPMPKIDAFIPGYEAALSISDLLTAVLLFGQFARSGLKSLLVLACAYLFNVLIIVPHALSFPGVFGPHGVIGGGVQTTAWLYCSGMEGLRFSSWSTRCWPTATGRRGGCAAFWSASPSASASPRRRRSRSPCWQLSATTC